MIPRSFLTDLLAITFGAQFDERPRRPPMAPPIGRAVGKHDFGGMREGDLDIRE